MPEIPDGETAAVQGSGAKPYTLKNSGGVCSCPAWRNQSAAIERRTCKHLRAYRGDAAETARLGAALPPPAAPGGSATGPPLLLAEAWTAAVDPAGWWVSEKLDGVRAYWDGAAFVSRLGNRFHAPAYFTAGLPAAPLDGELWIGRKQFQRTVGVVRRQDQPDTWKEVRFVVFDAPAAPGGFEARLAYLKTAALPAAAYAGVLDHAACTGVEHLKAELARVEALGGEGLMLRQPGSVYVAGRSATLLKVKSFLDSDAVVVGHEPGKGRHKGRLGALLVTLADGTAFSVGSGFTDAERESPPAVGETVVVVRYQELTPAGVPRFPTFAGVRAG